MYKMNAKKRKSIFALLAVALLLLVVGLFGLFSMRPKKTEASADTYIPGIAPSSDFYFNPGAAAGLEGWNLYMMKFRLWCTEDVIADTDYVLFVFTNDTDKTECKFFDDDNGDNMILIPKRSFSEGNGMLYYDVLVSTNLSSIVQISAFLYDSETGELVEDATSDERNLVSIWKAFKENDYEGLELAPAIKQTIEQALVDPTKLSDLSIGAKVNLGDYKVQLNIMIPPDLRVKLSAEPKFLRREHTGGVFSLKYRYYYERFDLMVYKTPNLIDKEGAHFFDWNELPSSIQIGGSGLLEFDANIAGAGSTTEYKYAAEIVRTEYYFVGSGSSEDPDIDPNRRGVKSQETYKTSNYTDYFSERSLAQEILTREGVFLNGQDERWLSVVAGVSTETEELPVTVFYKESSDNGYTVTDGALNFMAPKYSFFRLRGVSSALHTLTDFNNISDFNVIGAYSYYESTAGYDFFYETEKKIVLTADHYEYEIIYENDVPVRGELTVVYKPYNYKDVALRVTTLDENKRDRYTLDYYTSFAVDDGSTITLSYYYTEIQNNLLNGLGWIFTPRATDISVTLPQNSGIRVQKTDSEIIVTCPKAEEERLIDLDIRLLSDIESDYACTATYKYATLSQDGLNIKETMISSAPLDLMYSEIIQLNFYNFNQRFGDIVNEGCQPAFLGGVQHYKPVDIRKIEKSKESHVDENGDVVVDSAVYELVVQYDYETIFAIANNLDGTVTYRDLSNVTLLYTGEQFVDSIPEGYRVKSITSSNDGIRITPAEDAPDDYTKTKLQVLVDTNEREVLPIYVEYTDKWNIVIEYLKEYADYRIRSGKTKKPCFAKRERFEGEIKVADYGDIYALSAQDVQTILGLDKLTIMGLANVDDITVTYDNVATYTVQLSYTYATLKAINYDGVATEIKIPLSSYADWCEGMGQEWSILWLNTSDRQYFQYSNDIEREDLYGFFSVAVFDHRVSDLNYWFKNTNGDGFVTVYESTEVKGSQLYQKMYSIREKLGVAPVTTIAMGVSELINDKNKMVHSHFFYLDGTTTLSYLGENDPDSAEDTDGALGNQIQDGIDNVKELWEDIKDSPIVRLFKILLGAALIIGFVVIVVGLIRKLSNAFNDKKK